MAEASKHDPAIKRLWDELVRVRDLWTQYQVLFTTSEQRIDLLNQTARWFFYCVQRMLIDTVILSLSRLTDPLTTAGKRNLTLALLLEDPALERFPDLRARLTKALQALAQITAEMREHRNKRLAHLDFEAAVSTEQNVLPPVTRKHIEDALAAMEKAYQEYGLKVHDTHYMFELSALGGAEAIVIAVENAQKWREAEWAEMRRGLGLSSSDGAA